MHGVRQILHTLQFLHGDIPGRGIEHRRNPIDNRGTSMLHGSRFFHKERGIRFADNLPIAHVAVIGPIHFAIHWVSITGPWKVSVVTTALIPMHCPLGITRPSVAEYRSVS